MSSNFNWLRAVASSVPLQIYRLNVASRGGFPTQASISASTPRLAEGFGATEVAARIIQSPESLSGKTAPISSPFSGSAFIPNGRLTNFSINGQVVPWIGSADHASQFRVANAYSLGMDSVSSPFPPSVADRVLGPWGVLQITQQERIILGGKIEPSGSQFRLTAPFVCISSGRIRSEINRYDATRFTALHAFDATVPPDSRILEITRFSDSVNTTTLARLVLFAANSTDEGRAAVTCSDSGENFCLAFTGVERSGNVFVHPIFLASEVAANDVSGEFFVTQFPNGSFTSGIRNTDLPCLRPRSTPIDWAATRQMPFVGRADMTLDPKHKDFESPTNQRLFYPQSNGLGSAISPLPDSEAYFAFVEKSFTEADGTPSAILSSADVSWLELDVQAESNPVTAITPQAAEMPIVFQSNQSEFRIGGKVVQGTTVRFEPWASNTFIGQVESFGRNVVPIFAPLTTESYQNVLAYFATGLVEQNLDGIRWNAIGTTLSLIDRTDLGVIAPSETRLYDSRTYYGFTRSTTFGGTYFPNAQWDEAGYLAGLACSAMTQGGHIATTSEQQPPLANNTSGFLDSAVNVRYPVKTALTGASGYKPSLAGHDFSCTAANVEGVPYTAGTFQYRGQGGQSSVQLSQQMQGPIDFVEFQKPLPDSFPEDRSRINLPFNAGQTFYEASATHDVTMTTTFVDIVVKWFVSLQGPGVFDSSFSPTDINGADVDDLRGAVGLEHFVRTSAAGSVRPCLMAKVWVRAIGKVGIESDYEFPEILSMSGSFPAFARAWDAAEGQNAFPNPGDGSPGSFYGAVYPMDEMTVLTSLREVVDNPSGLITPGSSFRRDGSYATWEDNAYVDIGRFYFDGDQTAQLLAGNSVTATRWINDHPNLPQVVYWHNRDFGTYKLTFRLDFA